MWSSTLQTLIGHLFQHVDDAENIVVSTVFELLEPMPSEICFMLWLQRENLGVQRQMPRSPRGSVPMNGWMRGWLDGWMEWMDGVCRWHALAKHKWVMGKQNLRKG